METRNLPLRILYTVSGSQYILARSSSSIPVTLVPPTHASSFYVAAEQTDEPETRPKFGTTSLKTCLDAICISSPELVQDKRRDFSVYVLDPLESNSAPAQVNIPSAASGSRPSDSRSAPEQPRGLAVALGLMSWALMPDEKDSIPVTGTVIKLPTGQEALEIIFALKETVAMEKSSLPAALRTWGLASEPTASSSRNPDSSSGVTLNASDGQNAGSSERHNTHSTYNTHRSIAHSTETPSSSSIPSSSYPAHVPTDSTTLATIASIHMRSQHKRAKAKAKKPAKPSSIDPENSEADRLLLSHYIGPERKKAGRPPNATASGSKTNKSSVRNNSKVSSSNVVDSKTAGPSNTAEQQIYPSATHSSHSESNNAKSHVKSSKEPPTHPFTSAPLIRPPRDPEPQSLLDILAFLSGSSSSSDPNVQNSALLAALNAIDSSQSNGSSAGPDKPPGPLLVNALRELISAASQRPTIPPAASNLHPPINSQSRNHPPDDDVVLLDKENVNPTVFRRRSEREGKTLDSDASVPTTSPGSVLPSGNETPTARGLTTRSNGNINTAPVPPAPVPPNSNNSGVRRKRRLSDFMDEREASKETEKLRDQEWLERRDAHRHARSSPKRNEVSSIRHYPRLVSDITQPMRKTAGSYYRTAELWSSPRLNIEHHKSDENSPQRPITINNSPGLPKVSASSPVRSTTTKFRKPYVVPAWARTSTSMQPRLSEETARALETAEAKKKEERKARKREAALQPEKDKKMKRVAQTSSPPPETMSRQTKSTAHATQCPPPITVASDGPMFAITSIIQDRIAAFSSPVPSEPKSPRSGQLGLPCTPPRKRNSDLFSPGEDGSLFTPVPGRGFSITKTPVGFGSARKLSPKTLKTPKASKKPTEDGNEASGEESEDDLEDALNREFDNVLDDLDMPSGSLPTVSSDVEMENETTLSNQEAAIRSESFEDTDAHTPKKQHWVGLPPSSPPPPTSPLIMPQDDESDDTMLPAVTSDADPCPTDSEVQSDFFYNETSTCTDEELAEYLESDFASIFATSVEQPALGNDSTQANVDMFDQFTNHNVQSDGVEQNTILDPAFDVLQEGLVDFDLAEFWETFKPLLQDQNGAPVSDSVNVVSGQSADNQIFDPMSFDHMKLAEDVQALFSGCVV